MSPASRISRRPCPSCLGTECVALHEQRFILPEQHPLTSGYTVVSCEHCGLVYADIGASQEQFDEFYELSSKYEDAQTGTGGGLTSWDQNRLRDTAEEIARHIPRGARILDLGCANGGLLDELGKTGFAQLTGLDPSAACVATTRALGFPCRQGFFTRLPSDFDTFDCVVLSHVMEHVLEVREAMHVLATIVPAGGYVYIEVPDASRYHQFLVAPFQDFNTEHINHFSEASLDNLFHQFGFKRTAGGQKNIASSSDSLTPAVWAVYRATGCASMPVVKDRALREALEIYITDSRGLMGEIDRHLTVSLTDSDSVIVWGTGQLTMKLLCETVLAKHAIRVFVDSNPINQGKIIQGVRVISPRQLQNSNLGEPIVIGSLLHGREIIAGIRDRYHLPNRLVEVRPAA